MIARAVDFFMQNLPSGRSLALGGPPGLAWSLACLWFAGELKRRGVRTGYTRKVFHFSIFGTVAFLQWQWGTPAVCLFGATCTLALSVAVARGAGTVLYEGLAREKDAPHRTFFILVPYFTTLCGGLATNLLFGPFAIAGYLVTGLGDAIGEVAGTRFGKHRYRVWSRRNAPATRSLEGSAAVFAASVLALCLAAAASPSITLDSGPAALLLIAAACTLVEALSPHGWDNLTMQLVPTALVGRWMA